MRITCLGAARTVTGSSYLVEPENAGPFLVDCGMFQGGRQIELRNWDNTAYRVNELQAIFITHAHIDHSGLVPRLVRMGYRAPIYASRATCELVKILWLDSAHIQEMEANWQTKKNKRQGKGEVEALYGTPDAEEAIKLLKPVDMDCHQEILPGVDVCLVRAGHILGAASLMVSAQETGGEVCVGFSGDLGRPGQLIVPDPEQIPHPGTVFMETTYGNRNHKSLEESQQELISIIQETYADGGKVLIPAFAVERTQELIYTMAEAHRRGEMPDDMPVFLDSPLAIKATEIFRQHPEFFDDDTKQLLADGKRPLNFPNLKFTPSTGESQAINEYKGPAVIMAGNGMASAGRIKHHMKHNLWNPTTRMVIVGFQAQGTTGRRLVDGATTVKIFREPVTVRAQVHTIGGFSAHADREELLAWLKPLVHKGLMVNLVHGEEQSALAFKAEAKKRFPKVRFHIPRWKEVLEIKPFTGEEEIPARVVEPRGEAEAVVKKAGDDLAKRLYRLAARLESGSGELSGDNLAELEARLAEAEQAAGLGSEA